MSSPEELYPTCLFGFVRGQVRYETCGGHEIFPGDSGNHWLVWVRPRDFFLPNIATDFAVTHLQKRSKFGFLLMWPFCFHLWYTFKYQEQKKENGYWIPGTEKVLYWRFGRWRWDAGQCLFIGPWTWYGPGLHWD